MHFCSLPETNYKGSDVATSVEENMPLFISAVKVNVRV